MGIRLEEFWGIITLPIKYVMCLDAMAKEATRREISHIRRPTASQERSGKEKRRPAPFGMTGGEKEDKKK
jgi:hypothetical protein